MSKHGNHRRHINISNEKVSKKGTFDVISIIGNLLSNIRPEDVTALIASFNLGNLKNVNKSNVIQDGEVIYNPEQIEGQNNFRNYIPSNFSAILKSLVSYAGDQDLGKMLQLFSVGNAFKK